MRTVDVLKVPFQTTFDDKDDQDKVRVEVYKGEDLVSHPNGSGPRKSPAPTAPTLTRPWPAAVRAPAKSAGAFSCAVETASRSCAREGEGLTDWQVQRSTSRKGPADFGRLAAGRASRRSWGRATARPRPVPM